MLRTKLGALLIAICFATTATAQTTHVVDDDGFGTVVDCDDAFTPAFTTIQAAVNAAVSGDTIKICPGLYVEQVVVSSLNNSTIQGAGSGTNPAVDTIIQSPAVLAFSFVTSATNKPVVAVMNSDNVSISGVRVDGAGQGNLNHRFMGVAYRESDGALQNCVITGVRNTPVDGIQHGVALWVFNDLAGPYTLTVDNVQLEDYQKNGTVFGGPGLSVQVTNCTVLGAGTVNFIAQNGLQTCCGTTMTVQNTSIVGHTYSPATFFASGVIAFNALGDPAASVIATNVTSTDNQSGFLLENYNASIADSSITTSTAVLSDGIDAYTFGPLARGQVRESGKTSPYEESCSAALAAPHTVAQLRGGPLPDVSVSVHNCTITGNNVVNGSGVWTYSDMETIGVNVTNCNISQWDDGIFVNEDGGIVQVIANNNCIFSNSRGFGVSGTTSSQQNAENNYWGAASGPLDALGSSEADFFTCFAPGAISNADGLGNAVADAIVDYCPWRAVCTGGALTLETLDTCLSAGDSQLTVQLWMRGLTQNASGFFAHVTFDNTALAYNGALSSYTAGPFPLHLPPALAAAEVSPGVLQLNGSDNFGGSGSSADSHLATLVFNILPGFGECSANSISVSLAPIIGPFPTELSFQGVPLNTGLVSSSSITRDITAPVATVGAIATCYPSQAAAEAAALAAVSFVDNCGAVSEGVATVGTCSAAITVTGTDACGNSTAVELNTRIDGNAPLLSTVAGDNITSRADAGGCTALLTLPITASDDCDGPVTVSYAIDTDNNTANGYELPITNPYAFPAGVNSVRASAADTCGNSANYDFTVTVNAVNRVILSARLTQVFTSGIRCIRFVPLPGSCSATDVSVPVDFNSPSVMGVEALNVAIDIPCGAWTSLCAKDEQHSLWFTTALSISGTDYVANSLVTLTSGDTDNDSDLDINDVTWFLFQFAQLANVGGCPWTGVRDADFSLNGVVGAEDYSFLASNWLQFSTCACSPPRGNVLDTDGALLAAPEALAAVSRPTAELPAAVAAVVDVNVDGQVDVRDVELLEARLGLDGSLSAAMRGAAGQPQAAPAGTRMPLRGSR